MSISTITIPKQVTCIDPEVLFGCGKLKEIKVAKANKHYIVKDGVLFTIDGKTLIAYPPLKPDSIYHIPEGVTEIYPSAFCSCNNLVTVTIPEGISEIASDVFACCENLTSVTIPSSITNIGMRAFSRCKNLRDCNVPNSVKVYPDAFSETPLEGKYQ